MPWPIFIVEVSPDVILPAGAVTAILTLVLKWFMNSQDRRMKNVEVSVDRLARSVSLLTIALDFSPSVTSQARGILHELAEKEGRGRSVEGGDA